MTKCPNCNKELHCGCKSCIDRTSRKVDGDNTLIVWSSGETQTCAACGLREHCDWWLDKLHYHVGKTNND